jgi:carbohydrate diacid regulator
MRGKDRSDTMISNQILQDTIDGIKAITRIDLCVMDTEGKPLASTLDAVEEYKEAVLVFAESLAESHRDTSFLKFLMRTS